MDEIYVTYDEHVDNRDYDDTTDDDHDNNNGLAWSGPVGRTPRKDFFRSWRCSTLSEPERA